MADGQIPQNLPTDDENESKRITPPPVPTRPAPAAPPFSSRPAPFSSAGSPISSGSQTSSGNQPVPAPKPFISTPPPPPALPSVPPVSPLAVGSQTAPPPRPVPPPAVNLGPRPMAPLPSEGVAVPVRPAPVPPPPAVRPPEITLRTMKSDLDALKLGATPAPKPFSGITAPAEGAAPAKPLAKIELKGKSSKSIFIISGVIVFGIIIALLGYYVIFPIIFPATVPTAPAPASAPGPSVIPPAPTPVIPQIPSANIRPHQSLLSVPAEFQAAVSLATVNLSTLKQSLVNQVAAGTAPNTLKELTLSDTNGQVAFANILSLLLPELTQGELSNLFEDDFTALLYHDADGDWPIWVAGLKTGADLTAAKTLVSRLENSSALANLYLSSPGTPTGGFKTGQINNVSTRYLVFSQKGASFNYAWVGNKLVISASFNGLKKVLANL